MFKKLKSLFIIEDEDPAVNEESSPQSNSKASPPSGQAGKISTTVKEGKPTSKFTNVLLKALESNNLEGFDYLEFKQALQNLKKVESDEHKRYQSAFAMATAMNTNPAHLVKSAGHYLSILQKEEAEFQQAVKAQQSKQITEKNDEIKQLENMIKQKSEEIIKLNKEIESHQKQLDSRKKAIKNASQKVEATISGFMGSYQMLVGQIQKDIENMKKFMK